MVASSALMAQNTEAPKARRLPGINIPGVRSNKSGTYTVSGNFAVDLQGPVDTRPGCYGTADSVIVPLTFTAPTGFTVHIITLRGDLVSWIKTLPGDPVTPDESTAGILGGMQTSNVTNAPCDLCATGTPLYIQDAVSALVPKTRTPYNYTQVDMDLESDNILNLKTAAWLNTTNKPIHIEFTYTIIFTFVPSI
jgi:hypothetical protein